MRRFLLGWSMALAATVGLAAWWPAEVPAAPGTPAQTDSASKPVTLLCSWSGYTDREKADRPTRSSRTLRAEGRIPNVTVKSVGSINDDKIVQAIRGGNGPTMFAVVPDRLPGPYCGTGGLDRPEAVHRARPGRSSTRSRRRCRLHRVQRRPLRDAGPRRRLRPLLQQGAAGAAGSPARPRRLGADGRRQEAHPSATPTARSRSPASSRRRASTRCAPRTTAPTGGAHWLNADGKSTLGTDPAGPTICAGRST